MTSQLKEESSVISNFRLRNGKYRVAIKCGKHNYIRSLFGEEISLGHVKFEIYTRNLSKDAKGAARYRNLVFDVEICDTDTNVGVLIL